MKMRVLRISLLILFIFFKIQSGAEVTFFHYGVENGMPEPKVISISQDATGFIWLAGENSLFRFDGTNFKNYYYSESRDGSMFQGKITGLFTDSRGVLWVGGEYGIMYYDFMSDKFVRVPEWYRVHVFGISEDKDGNLWIGSDEGIACFNTHDHRSAWYTGQDTLKTAGNQILPVSSVRNIACSQDGMVWFSSDVSELYLLDPLKKEVLNYTKTGGVSFNMAVISQLKFHDNKIFIGTINSGLFWIDISNNTVHSENFNGFGATVQHFSLENDTVLWVASNNGVIKFNPKSREHTILTNVPDNQHSLIRTANIFVFVDRDKNLWVSNGIKGINYGLNNVLFKHFDVASDGILTLTHKEITSIVFQGEDLMWLGYEAGFIEKFNLKTRTKERYESASFKESRSMGSVMALLKDSQNQIWAGGWKTGLQRLNSKKNVFEYPQVRSKEMKKILETADVRSIVQDDVGNIWFTMHGLGIGIYNPSTFDFKYYRFNPKDPTSGISNNYTYDICSDKENTLWISSAYGLSRFNQESQQFATFLHNDSIPNSLSSNEINTVICDKAGTIWVGTNNGLNVYNADKGIIQPVLTDRDIPFLNIRSILSVKPDEIWISTQSGIIRLKYTWDTESNGVRFSSNYFDRSDGLISSSFFHRAAAISGRGEVYFCGNEGIDYFNPDKVMETVNTETPPLIIGVSVNGLPVTKNNLKKEENSHRVLLHHSDRMLTISFTALRFNNWKLKKFRYRLEGFSDKWTYTENEQVASFASLPPGKYNFYLEVARNSSGWVEMQKPLNIIVKPPFWRTWPFIFSIVVLVVLSVYLFHRNRSRIFQEQQRALEEMIEKRTFELMKKNEELELANQTKNKFFSIVSHDLRSPFSSLISIIELLNDSESELDEDKKRELLRSVEISSKNTFDFLETLLTWARSQMNQTATNPKQNDLCALIIQNIEMKMHNANSKSIVIRKHLPEKLDAYFDYEMINTVIRNILSNAVKFTKPGGTIDISLARKREMAEIAIADNGIGMSEDDVLHMFDLGKPSRKGTMGERGTGLGLIICKEFIEKNEGRFWFATNKPSGSIFYFSLPLSQKEKLS